MSRNFRPYLGHMFIGMFMGIITSMLVITAIASQYGVTMSGENFTTLSGWALGLFVLASIAGAIGVTLYMSPLQRRTYVARHAQRPAERR